MKPIKYYLNTDYESMTVLGVDGLFTRMRVDRNSLPGGYYLYSLREGAEEWFSSFERSVLINHAGDFICKKELLLDEEGILDLGAKDYVFTDKTVDLDEFFGVDVLLLLAGELDTFMHEIMPYEYADSLENGQKDMVLTIRSMLNDRDQVEGILNELKEIRQEINIHDRDAKFSLNCLENRLTSLLETFPENRDELNKQIAKAETSKSKGSNKGEAPARQ